MPATIVRMIELSFTTMNALIHEPHTFLCKYVHGLETFRTPAQEEGSRSHRIVQHHVSGRAEHPGLAHLPFFPHAEQQDFDPQTKVRMPIDEDFAFIGYVDGLNPQTGQFLEIKTGSRWGLQRFLELAQWKLYAAALPDYREVVFVNCPGSPETWSRARVAVFRHRIRPEIASSRASSSSAPSASSATSTATRSRCAGAAAGAPISAAPTARTARHRRPGPPTAPPVLRGARKGAKPAAARRRAASTLSAAGE